MNNTMPSSGLAFAALLAAGAAGSCAFVTSGAAPPTSGAGGGGGGPAVTGSVTASAGSTTSSAGGASSSAGGATSSAGGGSSSSVATTSSSVATTSSSVATTSSSVATTSSSSSSGGGLDCSGSPPTGTCAATPAGWTNVVFKPDPAFTCPTGYDTPITLEATISAPGSNCTCSCDVPSTSPCTQGQLSLSLGSLACGFNKHMLTSDGGCDGLGAPLGGDPIVNNAQYQYGKVKSLPAAPVSCPSTVTLPDLVMGVACTPSQIGSGCGTQMSCVPAVPEAGTACVRKSGAHPCPTMYPTGYTLYAPGVVQDARKCDPCVCTSKATSCSNATLTTYDDASCTANPVALTADNGCHTLPGNDSTNAFFQYAATPDTMACAPSPPAPPKGTATGTSPTTLCCP